MKYDYRISVIIPVYNSEEHLDVCFKSLHAQTASRKDFEILFVDDGSTDSSAQLCAEYASKHKNATLISKENGGVSSARNAGIEAARGKYLMFLDSDDGISKNAVAEVYKFFEKHDDEVDIVTYPLVYRREGSKDTVHKRYTELMKTDGVYCVNEYSNIVQTTMNVCVKNNENTPRFDVNLTMGEDQKFITAVLMNKEKIGCASSAKYFYYRYATSASGKGNYPYYCFDEYTGFLKQLIADYKANGVLPQYIQEIILYNLNWRATGDLLVDHSESAHSLDEQWSIIREIIAEIDEETIINSIYIVPVHKAFFARLKGVKPEVCLNESSYALTNGNCLWSTGSRIDLIFSRFVIRDSVLCAQGFVKNIISEFEPIEMYVRINDVDTEMQLQKAPYPLFRSKTKLNDFCRFDIKIPLENNNSIEFFVRIGGMSYTTFPYFWSSCLAGNVRTVAVYNGYVVSYNGEFRIDRKGFVGKSAARLKRDISVAFKSRGAVCYRALAGRMRGDIWLYCDRGGVIDNAYYQFKHDFKKKDGIRRYYITDGLSAKEKRELFDNEERQQLVKFGGFRHKELFLNSSKNLVSFNSMSICSPFGYGPLVFWYSDVVKHETVYLQHGVLHANLPSLYAREHSGVDRIVVSSQFEIDNFIKNYGYSRDDLIATGMPRYDSVDLSAKPGRKIIFSPSWRKNLIGDFIHGTRETMPEVFQNSDFYKSINEFINSPELAAFLEEYDLELDLKNHPIFEPYNEFFSPSCDRVHIVEGTVDMDDYMLMITDFSSIVFDFVYLEKPIVYFVPDYGLFLAGVTHTYRKMDLPLEEGFGDFTQTSDELLASLRRFAENGFMPDEVYAKRMHGFFLEKGNHCERLYNELMKG